MTGEAPSARSGRATDAAKLLAVTALAALSLWLWSRGAWRGLLYADDIEYASIARNVVRGQGVTSQFLNPLELKFWSEVRHPSFLHTPGQPLLIAAAFALLGVNDFAATFPSLLCFVLTPAVVFLIARRLHGERAAWFAAFLVAVNPLFLQYAVLAMAEAPAAFVVAFATYALLRSTSPAWAFVCGLSFAFAHAIRETFMLAVPCAVLVLPALVGAAWRKRAVLLVAGFAAGVAPLVVRSLVLTGRPWFSYGGYGMQAFTNTYPHLNVYRGLDAGTFGQFLSAHGDDFVHKYAGNLGSSAYFLLMALGIPLAVVAAAQLPLRSSPQASAYRLFLAAFLGLTCAALATFTVVARYFIPFTPLVAALAAGAVPFVWRRRPRVLAWGVPVGALLVVVLCAQAAWDVHRAKPARERDVWRGVSAFVEEKTSPGATIVTDAPECVIWKPDRDAVWAPLTLEDLHAVEAKVRVDYVLLTSIKSFDERLLHPWGDALRERRLEGEAPVAEFDDGHVRAALWKRGK